MLELTLADGGEFIIFTKFSKEYAGCDIAL